MLRRGWLTAILLASLLMPAVLCADDSSDVFFQAYQDFQSGVDLERNLQPRDALEKYRAAQKGLQSIMRQSPDWQPMVVEFRLKKTQEAILRLQNEVAALPPAEETPEGPLPEPDGLSLPRVSSEPLLPARPKERATPRPRPTYGESAGERELRLLREELARERSEKEKLSNRLKSQTAQLQSAQTEVDRTKVTVVELKSQLAQASGALENARKDAATTDLQAPALRQEFEKKAGDLLRQLDEAQTENEMLREENQRFFAKLERAAKYIEASDEIRKGLLTERKAIAEDRDQAVRKTKKIKDNSAEITRVTEENSGLKKQIAELEKTTVAKADLEKATAAKAALEEKLADLEKSTVAKADYDQLAADNRKLAEDFARLEKSAIAPETLGKLKSENDALSARIASLESSTVAAEEFEKLKAENATLTQQLADAASQAPNKDELEKLAAEKKIVEQKLAEAEAKLAAKPATVDSEAEARIVALQSDLNSASDKLLAAQAEVSQSEERVKNLQQQLDETAGELARLKLNPEPTKEETSLIAENEILRTIILRQIKDQSRRDQARKSIENELAKLNVKSDFISEQIGVLGEPSLLLTAEERSLFKDPIALLNEPGADSLEVTMAVTKPTADEAKKNNAPPAEKNGAEELSAGLRERVVQADKLFGAGNYSGAEKVYQEIVEAAPENYFALANLGTVQIETGKLTAAEVALKKAIEVKDTDGFAYMNLGIVYCRQGKFPKAVEALRRAIALEDNEAKAHNYLGVCLGQMDERAEAEKEFQRAIELKPDYPDAHFNLAVLYATTKPLSLDLAKQHYAKATQLGAPPDPSLERLIQ